MQRQVYLKPLTIISTIFFVIIVLIPTLIVIPYREGVTARLGKNLLSFTNEPASKITTKVKTNTQMVAVYRQKKQKIEKISIDDYVVGVVASEMPAEFEVEALKAQALSARTYIVKLLMNKRDASLPKGADIGDSIQYQVYKSKEELKIAWGTDYDWKMNKITAAVRATSGEIIKYHSSPITPSFFSTSNGYTENSEDYWKNSLPYLRAVASPWDKDSPKYLFQESVPVERFEDLLGVTIGSKSNVGAILSYTAGKRIKSIKIDGKTFTGREIREKLGLKSADFTWERKGNYIVITTHGYGHGVGMSQYGANGMAEEGKNYKEIIHYYYKGVTIEKYKL